MFAWSKTLKFKYKVPPKFILLKAKKNFDPHSLYEHLNFEF